MPTAYLTIDDSPSPKTNILVDYLVQKNIPALLFCRGDRLEKNMAAIINAIQKGMVIGNHTYAHRPSGELSYEEWVNDYERCDELIDAAYRAAGKPRTGVYYRFSYIDRGDGDRIEQRFPALINAVKNQENISLPTSEKIEKIQAYLKPHGCVQPFSNAHHPLYQISDIKNAADCLFTYSTGDWMLTARHITNPAWPHKTISDLCGAMDDDPYLFSDNHTGIVLLHDQEEISHVTLALIDHMLSRHIEFQEIR